MQGVDCLSRLKRWSRCVQLVSSKNGGVTECRVLQCCCRVRRIVLSIMRGNGKTAVWQQWSRAKTRGQNSSSWPKHFIHA